jgi:hypothetical protein
MSSCYKKFRVLGFLELCEALSDLVLLDNLGVLSRQMQRT